MVFLLRGSGASIFLDKGHLENIPSAAELTLNGIKLGEMMRSYFQKKYEELDLYTIQQERIIKLEMKISNPYCLKIY